MAKILQICHGYSGPFLDVAHQYADALTRCGYEVDTVYLTGHPSSEVEARTGGNTVSFLGQDSDDIGGMKRDAIRQIKALVANQKYVLCVTHRFKPAFVACLATKLPVVAVFHAYGTFDRWSRRLFARFFARRLLIVGVSDAIRDDIRRALGGSGPQVETFHNRIDASGVRAGLLSREEARQVLGLSAEGLVFGHVGRLHPDKDQATLLKGFAAAKERLPVGCKLVIIGSGKLAERLHRQAEELGLGGDSLLWIEKLPDARRYFRAFDAFVLSSDHEPFGMVVLEAMVADVPVVATAAGGVPEILGAGHPFLFPVGDAGALSEALVEVAMLDDNEVGALMVTSESRLQSCFTYEKAAVRFNELSAQIPFLLP